MFSDIKNERPLVSLIISLYLLQDRRSSYRQAADIFVRCPAFHIAGRNQRVIAFAVNDLYRSTAGNGAGFFAVVLAGECE